jgi:hypothetical protein
VLHAATKAAEDEMCVSAGIKISKKLEKPLDSL